jgi:hypothetical protein
MGKLEILIVKLARKLCSLAEWENSGSLVTFEISVEQYEDQLAELREIVGSGFIDQFRVDLQKFDFEILQGGTLLYFVIFFEISKFSEDFLIDYCSVLCNIF